jgi:hypothetical protein
MADEPQVIRGINWRETFPFTHLFRAFRVAVHPSKLVLGLILLLGIYTGGRILDRLWPARYLAIPDEVSAYEHARHTGMSSDEFSAFRRQQRAALEDRYAQRLLAEKIETTPENAQSKARGGGDLDEIEKNIKARRDETVAAAQKTRDEALKSADALKGKQHEDAERAAEAAYDQTARTAYRGAYADYHETKQIKDEADQGRRAVPHVLRLPELAGSPGCPRGARGQLLRRIEWR